MLHHLSFAVADLRRAAVFYDVALGALGYVRVWTAHDAVGYGVAGSADQFAIKAWSEKVATPNAGFHAAFAAPSRQAVDGFFAAAIASGATDNGAPGLRIRYRPHYYAAFVIDLDGYRIEAVIDRPV
jgi:catechol 2,3-dioxygenase-like lactoylglutathione lyase family enzyme